MSVLLGNGDGTFQAPVNFNYGGSHAQSVALGDLNGDGKPDLVLAGTDGVSVLLGNGDGTFQAPVLYSPSAYSVVICDLNGDGKLDLAVVNDLTVSVLLGNGDGTFRAPVSYNPGGYISLSVTAGDVNGDGKPDLIVANECRNPFPHCRGGTVGVLLGNGDGTFQAAVPYSSGADEADSVAIMDVNGDGKPDLAVANNCNRRGDCSSGVVSVLAGNGDGTFQQAISYSSGGGEASSVAIADVNADGRPDVIVADGCLSGCASGRVGVLLNILTVHTGTAVASSLNPSHVNQSVTFSATVTSNPLIPNGETVTFYNGNTEIGTGTTTNGMASLTTSFSTAGTYTIKASYPGDAFHKASSGTVKQVVKP